MIPRPLHLLARRVRQLVDPGVPILLYHRVTRLSSDPFEIAVSPERFAEDLEWIRRYAHPLPLAQVCDALAGRKLPRGTAAVTFDDGYVDVLDEARPLLERFDVPATVFVVSAILGQTSELWWDELDQIVFSPTLPADDVVFSGPGGGTSFDTRQPRGVLFHALYDFLFRLLPHERESAMDLLRQWAGHKPHLRPTHRGLTPDELIRLADGGLVEIGGHTATHPPLATIPAEDQQRDILAGKLRLEEILGRSVDSFAYPHGSFTAETVTAVRRAGFRCACATGGRILRRNADLFQIPRVGVRKSQGPLERMLAGWLRT